MIGVNLISGNGNNRAVKVSEEGQMEVVVHPHPPRGEVLVGLPLRSFLTLNDDGTTTNMLVDGSTTAQEFIFSADTEYDTYISALSFLISDASATLKDFGNLAALTNGCDLEWITADLGTVIIGNELKTNFDMVRMSLGAPAFGTGTAAFIAGNVSGTSEGLLPVIKFSEVFGLDYGLRLRKATNDKIVFRINDNVSTMDAFNAIVYGFRF